MKSFKITALVLLSSFALLGSARAADFVVTNAADSGSGTLRAAITAANSAGGTNLIRFNIAPSNSATIVLSSTLPAIANILTIDGRTNAAAITIDGALNHILDINGGQTAVIRNLTVQNGRVTDVGATSGAIGNAGTVLLDGITFYGNYAFYSGGGALYNSGNMTVTNCTFTYNRHIGPGGPGGGAIGNVGNLLITRCTFTDNRSFDDNGGVIFCTAGTLTVEGSTFSQNSGGLGGAIFASAVASVSGCTFKENTAAWGGAICNGSVLAVTNCTFYANVATSGSGRGGGAIYSSTDLAVSHCTFYGNSDSGTGTGGALFLFYFAPVTLQDCIFIKGVGDNCVSVFANLTTTNCLADDGTLTNATQVTASAINLGGLADFGGPTATMALLPGSVAINAGSAGPSTDQRGLARVGQPDIGAFEYQWPAVTTPDGAFWFLNPPAISNDWSIYRMVPGVEITLVGGEASLIGRANDGTVTMRNYAGKVYSRPGSTNGIGSAWGQLASAFAADGATWFIGPDSSFGSLSIYRWASNGLPTYSNGAGTNLVALFDGSIFTRANDQSTWVRLGSSSGLGSAWQQVYVASNAPRLKNTTRLVNGSVQFAFTNQAGMTFSVYASTNVAAPSTQWTFLGSPVESPAGTFQFTDSGATNSPQRYYRVTSP